ncbi:hypothetical protein [Peptoniphilus stercorisuis]|uniref:Uncharacterized protein n=1 Tax=Peptoniphilus stercorisuis TaxID=1436965 RepID=A0ABS4KEE7_9FIRM|nr:hypothetical protein [Peptoniphilus stercorisuis]MBP2026139.1 hypothetical protein [Peptoniphilus stercorisuis]
MIYKNPYFKKYKNSNLMIINCSNCKNEIIKYQKVGAGALINIYIERIISSSFKINFNENGLFCPICNNQIASRINSKKSKDPAYRMFRGKFNTRIF